MLFLDSMDLILVYNNVHTRCVLVADFIKNINIKLQLGIYATSYEVRKNEF